MKFRPATSADHDAILALNEESLRFLSPLDPGRLAWLESESAISLVVEAEGEVVAFLLAFREGAAYDSINYRWFAERYPSFIYVDRVVVARNHRRKGLGRALYAMVFERAESDAIRFVTCEFDIDPPNPAFERFHASLGFKEVGRQQLTGGKWVSLQAAPV